MSTKEAPHVEQARNELANAVAAGNEDGITRARKALDAAGIDGAAAVATARKQAHREQAATARAEVGVSDAPPAGRTSKPDAKTSAGQ